MSPFAVSALAVDHHLMQSLEPIRQNEMARFLKKAGIDESDLLELVTRSFLEKIIQLSTQKAEEEQTVSAGKIVQLFRRPEDC